MLITDFFGSVRQTVLFDEEISPLNKTVLSDSDTPVELNADANLELEAVSQLPF